jgi:hypothetical protein
MLIAIRHFSRFALPISVVCRAGGVEACASLLADSILSLSVSRVYGAAWCSQRRSGGFNKQGTRTSRHAILGTRIEDTHAHADMSITREDLIFGVEQVFWAQAHGTAILVHLFCYRTSDWLNSWQDTT